MQQGATRLRHLRSIFRVRFNDCSQIHKIEEIKEDNNTILFAGIFFYALSGTKYI
jgi:hypothetical protein